MGFVFIVIGLLVFAPLFALVFRVIYVIYQLFTSDCMFVSKKDTIGIVFCIGSGGHTSELLRLIKSLNFNKYQPRLYIVADNDVSSEVKIHQFEKAKNSAAAGGEYSIRRIPRSRNVHQSYLTSIGSTLHAIIFTVPLIYNFKPDVVLCNGPGTCIPICLVTFLFKCLFMLDCRIIFVESICRVRTLSLTGKILQFIADIVVVQWPQLRDVCVRAKYFGRLT